ncbi:MAG: glutathione S-transferase [Betaproteobacteria bacterium]
MTLKLCGFSASNYYNQIKLQLLEKAVAFEEELVWVGSADPGLTTRSPMGKVPFLETPQGTVSESIACAEYVEAAYPQSPLLPADAFEAAKVRELVLYLELHLELVARPLYAEAFFGGKVSDGTKAQARQLLDRGLAGFAKLIRFAPFVAGPEFTLADCAAIVHLPIVAAATKLIYGDELFVNLPVKDYLQRMGERATVQRVNADRKANTGLMLARRSAR